MVLNVYEAKAVNRPTSDAYRCLCLPENYCRFGHL